MEQQLLHDLIKTNNILVALITINIITFLLMGYDKHKAKTKQWRVSEKTLFMLVIFGGSLGGLVGMYVFHHKTKKAIFKYGFSIILFIHLIILLYVITAQ